MKLWGGRIAVYSRKSRFTGKGESIGNQVELCRRYIAVNYGEEALTAVEVFEDEGFSGSNLKRPAFQKMLDQIRERRFRAVIVYRVDRISRNIGDFAGLMDELTRLDVSFVSIREQFDTSSPMGRAMMYIISIFSQLERETIAERIRDNMHELAKTGRWLGGNTPIGYGSESVTSVTVDGKTRKVCKLKLIPEETQIVKTIFDLYVQTDSLTAVEAELLQRRLCSRQGNAYTRFSISSILRNPVYMIADENAYRYFTDRGAAVHGDRETFDGVHGIMPYNRTAQEKGKSAQYLPVEDWIIAVGKHPGLIPSEQWCTVQQSLERNRNKSYRKPRTNEALLTGLLYCSCGGRMYPKLTRRRTAAGNAVFSYVCKTKERSKGERCDCRNADGNGLDRAVADHISGLREDLDLFCRQMERNRRQLCSDGQPDAQLAPLRQVLTENERKLEGLIDAMALIAESSAKGRFLARIEELEAENRAVLLRIRELEGQNTMDVMTGGGYGAIVKRMAVFQDAFQDMTLEEKRNAVRSLVSGVVWDGTAAHVILTGAEREMPEGSLTRLCEDSK